MSDDRIGDSLADLTHLQDLFERLRSGRHVCAEDGALYLALRDRMSDYTRLFAALGFDLVDHARGFCYFRSDADLGKEASAQAVFFFVLVEAWSDDGRDLEDTVFDTAGHRIAELPHFTRESWRACMAEVGIPTPDALTDVLKRMERLGFTERIDDERFRFRVAAWRFLDLCRDVLEEHESHGRNADTETGDDTDADTPGGSAS